MPRKRKMLVTKRWVQLDKKRWRRTSLTLDQVMLELFEPWQRVSFLPSVQLENDAASCWSSTVHVVRPLSAHWNQTQLVRNGSLEPTGCAWSAHWTPTSKTERAQNAASAPKVRVASFDNARNKDTVEVGADQREVTNVLEHLAARGSFVVHSFSTAGRRTPHVAFLISRVWHGCFTSSPVIGGAELPGAAETAGPARMCALECLGVAFPRVHENDARSTRPRMWHRRGSCSGSWH